MWTLVDRQTGLVELAATFLYRLEIGCPTIVASRLGKRRTMTFRALQKLTGNLH